jgi:polyisoprenoid-binding protein YceI
VDKSLSRVGFSVTHLGFSKVRGEFGEFDARIEMSPEDLRSVVAVATIYVASVHTGDSNRDEHLRSEDFFKPESYPQLTFKSSSVKNISGNKLSLAGELTIRGVTRHVTLDAIYLGATTDPPRSSRVGFTASAVINRKDFGLTWDAALGVGDFLVSEDVRIELELVAVAKAV